VCRLLETVDIDPSLKSAAKSLFTAPSTSERAANMKSFVTQVSTSLLPQGVHRFYYTDYHFFQSYFLFLVFILNDLLILLRTIKERPEPNAPTQEPTAPENGFNALSEGYSETG
jgi:hypothetical protein